ncbi:anti-sigma factor [Streptomyces albipurpureus]|uniref:Regulator of SigK n=1 Tax=Streptomyces albipurpureus TaxID=2897419 RepID=A0ABT0UP46_9ACTN|nr:anti-sigma factor [Streptomyces sp. CWNU-1]MCM2390388.1 anti-sigma factor [Streptomyces sp. CWNU-1]
MTTADLHTLTGAYVLHALGPEERVEFEHHLMECPSCDQEVRELAATAGKLSLVVAMVPPPELKQQVMRRISTERQEPPGPGRARLERRSGGRALSRFVLAACVAAAMGLGGVSLWQHQEANDARQAAQRAERQSAELAAVLSAPDAKLAAGGLPGGAKGTVVVSTSLNKAAFFTSGMPEPAAGKVYQLWFNDNGTMRSAGLMNPATPNNAVLMKGPVDAASGMGVTVEPAGGSSEPTSAPLAVMNFPT